MEVLQICSQLLIFFVKIKMNSMLPLYGCCYDILNVSLSTRKINV